VAHDAALVVVHVAKGRRQVRLGLPGGPVEALGSGVVTPSSRNTSTCSHHVSIVAASRQEPGGVYDGEQLRLLARQMSNPVYDRLDSSASTPRKTHQDHHGRRPRSRPRARRCHLEPRGSAAVRGQRGACWGQRHSAERLRRCQAGDRMPYTPPSGWIEQLHPVPESRGQVQRFHLRANCSAIHAGTVLAPSDKPYSAALCPACAGEQPRQSGM
jgi:hypothetical protein